MAGGNQKNNDGSIPNKKESGFLYFEICMKIMLNKFVSDKREWSK
jgi:hypothetical protein